MVSLKQRSVNLLDFSTKEDIFLLDPYSDASEYGGQSDMALDLIKEEES